MSWELPDPRRDEDEPRPLAVAVLTLTRDRVDYTRHCLTRLRDLAGCDFDHYLLDQGSTDETVDWLQDEYRPHTLVTLNENVGIARGMNLLLDLALRADDYDVIVKVDNDCELASHGAVRDCAIEAATRRVACSPVIRGLRSPVPLGVIGGIFFAVPADFYHGWRCPEQVPLWAGDDDLTARARELAMPIGYLTQHEAWHYETTDGQHARYPDYFARKRFEGCPC